MRKKSIVKVLSVLLSALMIVALFGGCSSQNTSASSGTATKGTITMWGWNQGDIQKLFTEFNKTYPDLKLNYVAVQQADAFQKLQTTVSAGLTLPDIVPMEIHQRGTMIGLNIWENLDKAPYNYDRNADYSYTLPLVENLKGQVVAVPWDISSAALAFNRVVAKNYLGTDDPAQVQNMVGSWDALLSVCQQVKTKSNGAAFGFASLGDIQTIADGQNPTPIVKNGKLDLSSIQKTANLMAQFRDAGVADNISPSSTAYNASYATNKYLFYPCAAWTPQYTIATNDPNGKGNWGLILPPGGCFSWGGTANGIPSKAKDKLQAWTFLKWAMMSEAGAEAQRNILQYNIAFKGFYNNPQNVTLTNVMFGDQDLGQIFFKTALQNLTPRPISPYDVIIQDTWSLVVTSMIGSKSFSATDAVNKFETEMKAQADVS